MTDEARAGEPRPRIIECPHCREQVAIEHEVERCNEDEGTVWHYCDYDSPHHLAAAAPALDVERLATELYRGYDYTVTPDDLRVALARLSESADDR